MDDFSGRMSMMGVTGNEMGSIDMNIEQIRQRLSEFKDTTD